MHIEHVISSYKKEAIEDRKGGNVYKAPRLDARHLMSGKQIEIRSRWRSVSPVDKKRGLGGTLVGV